MLVCFDKAERHLPDRCLKQFGMVQTIPENVQIWERKTRGVDGGVDLITKMQSEVNEWSNRRFNIVEAEEDTEESEYMQWYIRITRRFVGRPVPISSVFQRMNAALRDVANLADTISTYGMNDQQIQTVSRIRYIVHDCLNDKVRSSPAVPTPQTDLGKKAKGKARGKEMLRKDTGKRRKKGNSVDHEGMRKCIKKGNSEDHEGTRKHRNKGNSEYHASLVTAEQSCRPPSESNDAESINAAPNYPRWMD
ncbi:hypothetical protein Leryth_000039 [Lithospermum erythrorhizon]|nr:hypothetical protein Leryth_000039 [Lithospermum erythrorhizon]